MYLLVSAEPTITYMNTNKEKILHHLLSSLKHESLAILAGHFSLVVENGISIPGIYQSVTNEVLAGELKKNPYSAEFPLETFSFGMDFLSKKPATKIVSLVNDWQLLPKNTNTNISNPYRNSYYQHADVPHIFIDELASRGLNESVFLEVPKRFRVQKNALHISETKLRNMFASSLSFSDNCSLENNCAQEFVPFIHAIHEAGIKELLCIIPATCQGATLAGTKHVLENVGLPMTIWGVYIYNTLDISRFWNGVWVFKNGEYEMTTED